VQANSQIALVGSQIIYTKEGGIVSSAPLVLGSYYSPGQIVVSVVNDEKMRVIGKIEETKGLDSIKVGQPATFTVDTFPDNEYEGIVDEISPVSNNSGILFSISDKRPVNKFNVYITFDVSKYPELKSGMSAKLLVDIR
jgi:multidrug resistance efflux pump